MDSLLNIAKNILTAGAQTKPSTHPYYHLDDNSPVERIHFRVEATGVANAMYGWYLDCDDAHQQVAQFVYAQLNNFQMQGNLEYDVDGNLWRSAFGGVMPRGWGGNGDLNSNWLYPQDNEAKAAVARLPKLPSRKELHDMIDWPTLDEGYVHKDLKHMVRFANLQAGVYGDENGQTHICVPHPDNFERCPQIQNAYQDWFDKHIPDFLVRIEPQVQDPDVDTQP